MEHETAKSILSGISSDAIVGIIGTLLGTILGWLLSVIQNQGRMKIYIKSWEETFIRTGGGMLDREITDIDGANYYSYMVSVEVYNGSGKPRILRDISIDYAKKTCFRENTILRSTPDDATTSFHSAGAIHYEKITAQNISPNEIITLQLRCGFTKEANGFPFRKEANRIFFVYKDMRNRQHKSIIRKLDPK